MKNTKEMLIFLFALHMTFDKANADGKIDTADLGLLMDPISKAVPALSDINQIEVEVKNATDQDIVDLKAFIKENYDIADDVLEAKIENALALAPRIAQFLMKL